MTTIQPLLSCDEHAPTPPRLQQIAAAQLSDLYGDADYLATPERWDAASLLARAARFAHPRLLDGSFNGWLDRWEDGERVPLAAIDADDRHDTDRLARAVLTVHGHLTGPTLTTAHGLDLATGDTLVLGWDRDQIAEFGYAGVLDRGMLADVADLDADNRTFTLEVPIAGVRVDVRADSPHAAALTYAYTDVDIDGVAPAPATRHRDLGVDHAVGDGVDVDAA